MTTGSKIAAMRRECNYTQEQLAELLGVSRQSVSKWESDLSYPETEKLVRLGQLFGCSMDYLLKDDCTERQAVTVVAATETAAVSAETVGNTSPEVLPSTNSNDIRLGQFLHIPERKSEKTIGHLPLYHIGRHAKGFIAVGIHAKGVLAVGLTAKGLVSVGLLSLGVLSVGVLSLALLAFGVLAVGLVAVAAIAVGLLAIGAVALGVVAIGAVSIGTFSLGALAIGQYLAVGDHAYGMIALGKTKAAGDCYQFVGRFSREELSYVTTLLSDMVPTVLSMAKDMMLGILSLLAA